LHAKGRMTTTILYDLYTENISDGSDIPATSGNCRFRLVL
jgi:hypothetical protein